MNQPQGVPNIAQSGTTYIVYKLNIRSEVSKKVTTFAGQLETKHKTNKIKILVFWPFQFKEKEKINSRYKHNKQVSHDMQLFRQRLSHESVKANATILIGIMGSKSLALLD